MKKRTNVIVATAFLTTAVLAGMIVLNIYNNNAAERKENDSHTLIAEKNTNEVIASNITGVTESFKSLLKEGNGSIVLLADSPADQNLLDASYLAEQSLMRLDNGIIVTNDVFEKDLDTADDELKYSVDYASKEWAEMSTAKRIAACNINPVRLKKASTETLLELAVNYPLKGDMLAFDSYEEGFLHLKNRSTVFFELLSREDLKSYVLNKYESYENYNDSEGSTFDITILEAIIKFHCMGMLSEAEKNQVKNIHNSLKSDAFIGCL